MSLYNFDACAIIDLWDNYPIQSPHFNSVWEWFADHVNQKSFIISDIAIDEVKQKILYDGIQKAVPKSIELINILDNFTVVKKTASDLLMTQQIKKLLDIEEDGYHTKGVGENDLMIIANAKGNNAVLVTNEERQGDANKIKVKAKYKIPAVCNLNAVQVENINLAELLHIDSLW
jgi:predicted nucleic acid-binding protein